MVSIWQLLPHLGRFANLIQAGHVTWTVGEKLAFKKQDKFAVWIMVGASDSRNNLVFQAAEEQKWYACNLL